MSDIQKSIEIESTSLNRIFRLIELQVKSSKVKKDRLIQMCIYTTLLHFIIEMKHCLLDDTIL